MEDLAITGEEPSWEKMEIMNTVLSKAGDGKDKIILKNEVERLRKERGVLAGQIQKTQDLLKCQVDIDKQNIELLQEEIKNYHMQI